MQNSNSEKLKSFINLLAPSLVGIIIYILIFIISLLLNKPTQLKSALQSLNSHNLQGSFIYKYLHDISVLINTQIVNQITVYAFWVVVGVIVFVIASRFTKDVTELADDFSLRNYIWPKGKDKNAPIKEFIEKLIFRIFVFVLIMVYIFKALPFLAHQWASVNLSHALNLSSFKTYLGLFITEVVVLHILIILVRLFLLKRRIIEL